MHQAFVPFQPPCVKDKDYSLARKIPGNRNQNLPALVQRLSQNFGVTQSSFSGDTSDDGVSLTIPPVPKERENPCPCKPDRTKPQPK